jgi:hypothetical protein
VQLVLKLVFHGKLPTQQAASEQPHRLCIIKIMTLLIDIQAGFVNGFFAIPGVLDRRGHLSFWAASPNRNPNLNPNPILCTREIKIKSGGGPPQSKTLAGCLTTCEKREAFWSAPVLWRFGMGCKSTMTTCWFENQDED